jgi:translation initiation factor IF-3
VRVEDALRLALEADLDLVEVAPDARPPVCKIMDYGKFKYEAAQKARESRKNQQLTVIKEQKLRPKIDDHDYETKKRNVVRFLEAGSKVKVTIMFRGREQSRPELGFRLLQRLGADVADLGFVETSAKQDGRNMTMVLAPHKGAKTRVKAQESAAAPPAQRAVPAPAEQAPSEPAGGSAPGEAPTS